MAAATQASGWKTMAGDSFGIVLVIWAIPVAMLAVGAPIVLIVALARWLF